VVTAVRFYRHSHRRTALPVKLFQTYTKVYDGNHFNDM